MYDNSTGSCISVVGVGCIYIQGEEKGRRREEGGGRRDPPEVWRNVYLVRHGNYRRSCEGDQQLHLLLNG